MAAVLTCNIMGAITPKAGGGKQGLDASSNIRIDGGDCYCTGQLTCHLGCKGGPAQKGQPIMHGWRQNAMQNLMCGLQAVIEYALCARHQYLHRPSNCYVKSYTKHRTGKFALDIGCDHHSRSIAHKHGSQVNANAVLQQGRTSGISSCEHVASTLTFALAANQICSRQKQSSSEKAARLVGLHLVAQRTNC